MTLQLTPAQFELPVALRLSIALTHLQAAVMKFAE